MRNFARTAQQGFTLIELIMSIVLLGILAAFGSSMIYNNMTTVVMVNSGQGSVERARYAMGRLSREIREVTFTSSVYLISSPLTAGTSNLIFVRDISGTGPTTVTIDKVSTNVRLLYSPDTTASTLVDNVSSFTFNFYDSEGVVTASTADVRFVMITMVVTDATSGQSVSQRMRVALRNA